MNEYSANLSVIVCAFFEFIIVAYIYGKIFREKSIDYLHVDLFRI